MLFDTRTTGIIGDKFHFIEAKKKISMKKERKQTRKTVSKLQSLQKKLTELSKSK